jgi:tRNA uridine 5-carboxymethylaminomethyl modification enzyme
MTYRDFDIVVVGGGHAGVEAALAGARMGKSVALVTMDKTKLALMSCNPAVGGIGKSQLVKEVDALGGVMGEAIDATGIQFRRLNLSRGPAVWSTRAQADRLAYTAWIIDYISRISGVQVIEGTAGKMACKDGFVTGILTERGEEVTGKAVILTTGTFLRGLIHIGDRKIQAGRRDEPAACRLSESLDELGFILGRLKTGTPPRLNGDTIDWSKCERQLGETPVPFFSYRSPGRQFDQTPCYLTQTTARTKEIIAANFKRSPIFSGQITSRGPRYCPSIEDKYFRFADKLTHQIFLEPEGNGTNEVYPNGFSTALPEDVQHAAIRTIRGLEQVEMTQPGYAIEYDYSPAYQVERSLQTRQVKGLFFAGQINGTSGYEEAAAQGLMAGINAALFVDNQPPFVLDRSEAYTGVMIDDLTTRSTTEPYRMFTSRAEYRLALREDNARDRLFGYARKYGLIAERDGEAFEQLKDETNKQVVRMRKTMISTAEVGGLKDIVRGRDKVSLAALLKRPGVDIAQVLAMARHDEDSTPRRAEALQRAAVLIRYEGYIDKQDREIERFRRLETEVIPEDFAFGEIAGLKNEAREKFSRFRPSSLGQAGRIEGITPGDVAVLSVSLKRHKAMRGQL